MENTFSEILTILRVFYWKGVLAQKLSRDACGENFSRLIVHESLIEYFVQKYVLEVYKFFSRGNSAQKVFRANLHAKFFLEY